ncbi:MAG: WYL domain-containing protein [Opitutaceae bacterium]|nr:WYL domain-containing protein [Opitutaceae bacterium]
MGNKTNTDNWSARERLLYLDRLAYWRGWVRRADLSEKFGISVPQASADIAEYLRLNPRALRYDLNRKRYVTTSALKPAFDGGNLDGAMQLLVADSNGPAGQVDRVARIDLPHRHVSPEAIRDLVRAVFAASSIDIYYYSMSSGTEGWRTVSPHAFAHDGYRWHMRAWGHDDHTHKDFVLGRIARVRPSNHAPASVPRDVDWHEYVNVRFQAHRGLSAVQREALERDFAMRDGVASVRVRKAMLLYTLVYLGLAEPDPVSKRRLALVGKALR